MVNLEFKKQNLDRVLKALDSSENKKNLAKVFRKGLNKAFRYVTESARRNHRYQDRTGNLSRSINFYTHPSGLFGKYGLSGFTRDNKLDSMFTAKSSSTGEKYGARIHQGFKRWQPDQFIFYNFDNSKNTMFGYLRESFEKVLKKIGG